MTTPRTQNTWGGKSPDPGIGYGVFGSEILALRDEPEICLGRTESVVFMEVNTSCQPPVTSGLNGLNGLVDKTRGFIGQRHVTCTCSFALASCNIS